MFAFTANYKAECYDAYQICVNTFHKTIHLKMPIILKQFNAINKFFFHRYTTSAKLQAICSLFTTSS